ncbi:MAG: anthranilate synthase component I [Phycisphaerales bacterium]|nr:MAG: anthranilate synthase component I [Phycisphaerales bacterium]
MPSLSRDQFVNIVDRARRDTPGVTAAVPVSVRLLADQLTPVLAYRRLVAQDERTAPSFLLESIEGGERQGRYSIMGAHPVVEVLARGHVVTVTDRRKTGRPISEREGDPLLVLRELVAGVRLMRAEADGASPDALPSCVLAGWFGYAAYDTVRYAEPEKLDRRHAPPDDRTLPDMHFGLYDGVVVFDHVASVVHLVQVGLVGAEADASAVYDRTVARLEAREEAVQRHSRPLPAGRVPANAPASAMASNLTREAHAGMVGRALEYIRAGDIFQVVLGQRFERRSSADPFDVYRALRAVNPSPYMVYMQTAGCILVASSPEILCRVRTRADGARIVTNRPLAGTRRRGATPEEDAALEAELLADAKERAEHVMLVDLGRNDVGRVAQPGTVALDRVMEIERYSHVMHISSTVTGELREGLDCWDALRAALPVGTISGAPKVRAMQIIDELEPVRRGPYGGGMGYAGLDGEMDVALALRTIVVPTGLHGPSGEGWAYHIQAAGGIVADSDAGAEYQETVNKAAALARAIDVAEAAFGSGGADA